MQDSPVPAKPPEEDCSMAVKPIPDGYGGVSPYLIVHEVPRLIEFISRVFGGTVVRRHDSPDGGIMHAEVRIGDSIVMMGSAGGEWTPVPAALYLYVTDVDAVYRKALEAGATSLTEPADQYYGDRMAGVKDPSGNTWFISTHVEDVADEEMARRGAEAAQQR
jgi:PhnB protein